MSSCASIDANLIGTHHFNIIIPDLVCLAGPLMVIVEYCKHGNLSSYLKGKRGEYSPYKVNTQPVVCCVETLVALCWASVFWSTEEASEQPEVALHRRACWGRRSRLGYCCPAGHLHWNCRLHQRCVGQQRGHTRRWQWRKPDPSCGSRRIET